MSAAEDIITELENDFPSLSGEVFSAVSHQGLASGQSVLQSMDGVIYEVFPDGHRVAVKQIEKPIPVEKGRKIRIS